MIKPPLSTADADRAVTRNSFGPATRSAPERGPGTNTASASFEMAVPGLVEAAARPPAPGPDEAPGVMDRILDDGFQAYAAQIKAENLQNLREKILNSMGLTQENLERMPREQREAIEDMVAKELERRMMALAELDEGRTTRTAMMTTHTVEKTAMHVRATFTHVENTRGAAMTGSSASGLGPLLALQEIELARAEGGGETDAPPGKNDRPGSR